jgi:hypothetical protein
MSLYFGTGCLKVADGKVSLSLVSFFLWFYTIFRQLSNFVVYICSILGCFWGIFECFLVKLRVF